jgi:superoxide dismutase, Cu-Zn family
MKAKAILSLVLPVAVLLATGCVSVHKSSSEHHAHADTKAHAGGWAAMNHAVAVIYPTAGNQCSGVVRFQQIGDTVKVVAEISGLKPNQQHGFHIHEFGDASSSDGLATGGHYNPEGHAHALPNTATRHAGDFGNLQADANGKARMEFTVANISIAGLRNPVLGRGVIVHANPDDGSQPVGNAGPRIGQGVIGLAKSLD